MVAVSLQTIIQPFDIMVNFSSDCCSSRNALAPFLRRARARLVALILAQMPQLVHSRRLTGYCALDDLERTGDLIHVADSILRRLCLDPDQCDSRIIGLAVVDAIAEVTEPRLERWGVVLLDCVAVGLDDGFAGDGGPFTGVVEEAEVDVRVGFEVVCFAGFGVGVEDEVDGVFLLCRLVGETHEVLYSLILPCLRGPCIC